MENTEDGVWFVMSPDELMASFYVPLLEPIGIPAGTIFISIENLDASIIQMLYHAKPDLVLGKRSERGGYELHPFPDEFSAEVDPASRPPLYWANKHLLSCSILVHQLKANFLARTSLDAAFAVANATSSNLMPIEDIAAIAEDIRRSSIAESLGAIQALGAATVMECAVGLRVVNDNPNEEPHFPEGVLITPEHPQQRPIESHEAYPMSSARWTWYRAGANSRTSMEFIERRVSNALDIALESCRVIQQAYYVATARPTTLITRARLPFIVPASIRRVSDISDGSESSPVALGTNGNLHGLAEPEYVEDVVEIHKIAAQVSTSPLAAHADLEREARAAYVLQGDMRATAIFSAISAETFLDKLLLHLMWEEAKTPEEAAEAWVDKLAARVRSSYSSRIGGSWDLTLHNPVGNWYRNVADLRNRVAHAAYLPEDDEAKLSLASLNQLVNFVGDLLSRPQTLSRYPRTCVSIFGNDEMERRGLRSRRIVALQSKIEEPDWNATFKRWFECWQRIRRDQNGIPRTPEVARANLLAIIKPEGKIEWCLHDRTAAKSMRVQVNEDDLSDNVKLQLAMIVKRSSVMVEEDRLSVSLHDPPRWTGIQNENWVEEYHLIPLAGVMVDRSDYRR